MMKKLFSAVLVLALTFTMMTGVVLGAQPTYTVQKGDTLYQVSKKTGVSVTELTALNAIKDDKIKVGQVLNLTAKETVAEYLVQKGDSLSLIAKNYETSVSELKKMNNLKNDKLTIGQMIKVPCYVVETLTVTIVGAADNNSVEVTMENGEALVVNTTNALNISNSLSGEKALIVIKHVKNKQPKLMELLPFEKK